MNTTEEMELFQMCSQQCRLADKSEVLSVMPKKGMAVVFWSVYPDGFPNTKMWHAACQAMSGDHRYALQKFKEFPRVTGEWVLEPEDTPVPKWISKLRKKPRA
mmetsp:Transcript_4926/g.7924  ORF Transcript_4926/g.7924 Transcript_4926/m.7924 type:complete len:103 (-) Transcript_4926:112-420(-)